MESQLNELSKGEKTNNNPNKYNFRSKKKEGKHDITDQPTITEKLAKDVTVSSKEKKAHNPPPMVKSLVPEVR
jgi:hypothetical protein